MVSNFTNNMIACSWKYLRIEWNAPSFD